MHFDESSFGNHDDELYDDQLSCCDRLLVSSCCQDVSYVISLSLRHSRTTTIFMLPAVMLCEYDYTAV